MTLPTYKEIKEAAPDLDGAVALVSAVIPALDAVLKKQADELYAATLEAVQDYLCDNVQFNVRSRLDAAEHERRRQWERAEALAESREKLAEALRALLAEIFRHGDWDDGCFYYLGTSASELQAPIEQARAALQAVEGSDV